MLVEFDGANNSPDMLPHAIGETIGGTFEDGRGATARTRWLVMESGYALVIYPNSMRIRRANPGEVAEKIRARHASIEASVKELGNL